MVLVVVFFNLVLHLIEEMNLEEDMVMDMDMDMGINKLII